MPWKLLYADDLFLIPESEMKLYGKLVTGKLECNFKSLIMNTREENVVSAAAQCHMGR